MLKNKINHYLFLGALALFIYMPFHIFLSQWLSLYTSGLDIWKIGKDVFTLILCLCLVLAVYLQKKASKTYTKLIILISLYALIHLVIGLATSQPKETFILALIYNLRIFGYLIIGYSLVLIDSKKQLFDQYKRILIILSSIVCLLAVIQWLMPKDLLVHFGYSIDRGVKPNFFIDDKPDLPRLFSTLRDPNSLGAFLILPITILVHSLIINWRNHKKTMLTGLLILHVLVLMLTFSRSAFLATIISVVTLLMFTKKDFIKHHKTKIIYVVTILCIVTLGFVYILRDQYFVQNTVFHADENTQLASPNELRRDLAKQSLGQIIDQPLGHGPGTAGLVSIKSDNGLLTENYYLQILYEVGIIGFGIFAWIIGCLLYKLSKKINKTKVLPIFCGFVGLLFIGFFFHVFSNEALSISAMMLVGILLKN